MGYTLISDDEIASMTGGVFLFTRTLTVSDTLLTSPAYILGSYLIEEEIGSMTDPVDVDDWPLYVGFMPDGSGIKTELCSIYDTSPQKDGRSMEGPVFQHYAMQLKIRSDDYVMGYAKLEEIASDLDAIHNETITISDAEFQIQNITRSGVIPLGMEPSSKKRFLFTVNLVVAMRRVT